MKESNCQFKSLTCKLCLLQTRTYIGDFFKKILFKYVFVYFFQEQFPQGKEIKHRIQFFNGKMPKERKTVYP